MRASSAASARPLWPYVLFVVAALFLVINGACDHAMCVGPRTAVAAIGEP